MIECVREWEGCKLVDVRETSFSDDGVRWSMDASETVPRLSQVEYESAVLSGECSDELDTAVQKGR